MKQKNKGCRHYQRVSNSFPGSQVRTFPTWNWECLGARWNSQWKSTWFLFKHSNSITAEGVGSDLCVSLLSARGKIIADGLWQAKHFPGYVYTSLSPKMFPNTAENKVFRLQQWKKYFLIQCNSRFQTFFTPRWCETKTSWRFSQRESMLSLALPDQAQHVVQPGLTKRCKAKTFSKISRAPGCLGVDCILYRWSCYIYTLPINTQTSYCSQDLIPVEYMNLIVVIWDYIYLSVFIFLQHGAKIAVPN